MRLVRPVLPTSKRENVFDRDAARRISEIRDAQAAIETFDGHLRPAVEARGVPAESTLDDVRRRLVKRRDAMAAERDLGRRLDAIRAELVEGRNRVPDLPIATEGYDAVAGGLRKSYKRVRNRMADAYEDPEFERFHEWRKRIEYHRYHTRLLRRAGRTPADAAGPSVRSVRATVSVRSPDPRRRRHLSGCGCRRLPRSPDCAAQLCGSNREVSEGGMYDHTRDGRRAVPDVRPW